MLDHQILSTYGAEIREYEDKTSLFMQDDNAENYFQIVKGVVKLMSKDRLGTVQIHDLLFEGSEISSFALYNGNGYPVSAVTENSCSIYVLSKMKFFKMVEDHPSIAQRFLIHFSEKANYQYQMEKILFQTDTKIKIQTFLNLLKTQKGVKKPFSFEIKLTRNQLAMFVGLRVETVIRYIKAMERDGLIRIIGGKIFC